MNLNQTQVSFNFKYDDNLREVPADPSAIKLHILKLIESLNTVTDKKMQVSTLGEIGTYLRCIGELDLAEKTLHYALQIIDDNNLGVSIEIQQKIRLAHVLQWQKKFDQSNLLFSDVVRVCKTNPAVSNYLDFALQHSGKNLFDQNRLAEALSAFQEAYELRKLRNAPFDQLKSTDLAIKITKKLLV